MNDVEKYLNALREKLDAADRTPFGDVGKLLDAMATDADAALALIKTMKQAA